jgi:phospholipase/carboxylesterase
VFPHAPLRSITINQGYTMRAWYDIAALDLTLREDAAGIGASDALLCDFIQREVIRGIASQRIVLAGFSQGGAMSLYTGLRYPEPLAGILCLSGYLPLAQDLLTEAHPANAAVPILMVHGWQDSVIPLRFAEASRDTLQGLGYQVEWHVYTMAHGVCAVEIEHISACCSACSPSSQPSKNHPAAGRPYRSPSRGGLPPRWSFDTRGSIARSRPDTCVRVPR